MPAQAADDTPARAFKRSPFCIVGTPVKWEPNARSCIAPLERKRRPTGFTDEHDTVLFFSTFPFARSRGVHTGLGFDE
jgi:hypothetical protein